MKEEGPAEVLSSACPSSWAEVAYYFKARPQAAHSSMGIEGCIVQGSAGRSEQGPGAMAQG